jgi:YHS domain-containing protein
LPPHPPLGSLVPTACGGTVQYSAATPCVYYQGRKIYFCLPICKADFDSNPAHSCLSLNRPGIGS